MPYTIEDFRRDVAREYLPLLTAEERLKGVPAEERLKGLPMEEILKHIPIDTIREYLNETRKDGNGTEPPARRPKKPRK